MSEAISIDHEGHTYTGRYTVTGRGDRAIVAVDSAYGSKKATAGPSGPDVIAHLLLGELVRAHSRRGCNTIHERTRPSRGSSPT